MTWLKVNNGYVNWADVAVVRDIGSGDCRLESDADVALGYIDGMTAREVLDLFTSDIHDLSPSDD